MFQNINVMKSLLWKAHFYVLLMREFLVKTGGGRNFIGTVDSRVSSMDITPPWPTKKKVITKKTIKKDIKNMISYSYRFTYKKFLLDSMNASFITLYTFAC